MYYLEINLNKYQNAKQSIGFFVSRFTSISPNSVSFTQK